jgi:hypothetical protein
VKKELGRENNVRQVEQVVFIHILTSYEVSLRLAIQVKVLRYSVCNGGNGLSPESKRVCVLVLFRIEDIAIGKREEVAAL